MPVIKPLKEKMFDRSILPLSQLSQSRIFPGWFEGYMSMSKRELIDYICEINKSARPEFLAVFSEEDLNAYLEHLMELDLEELAPCCA